MVSTAQPCNQVPHLTQDTNWKVTNSQKTPQTRAKRSALSQPVTTKHKTYLPQSHKCRTIIAWIIGELCTTFSRHWCDIRQTLARCLPNEIADIYYHRPPQDILTNVVWQSHERRYFRDENSQPFSIRKICCLTPIWRKAIFKSLIKGLNHKISIETSQFMLYLYLNMSLTIFKNRFQQKQQALYKSYASAQSGNPDQSWIFSCLAIVARWFWKKWQTKKHKHSSKHSSFRLERYWATGRK